MLGLGLMGIGLGVGLIVIGAAYGIGKLATSSVESIARQPEAAGNIRTTAIILAAGPGSRLLPHTAHAPMCLTHVVGFSIL